MPPFTQHSDAPQHDELQHGFHAKPEYEEVTGFVLSADAEEMPPIEGPDEGVTDGN